MANSVAIQKLFLSSPAFAVIGASKDQTKFGTKILNWYKARGLAVQPIHPKEDELEDIATVRSVAELSNPTQTSLSIITPPHITLGILKEAIPLGVPAVWIQPGAADAAVIDWLEKNGAEDRVIHSGPCLLVSGDQLRSSL
ncbi:NAD-P-binding protein [Roridomyces roridus]|uniref:NAD-P-binding protein n=1 Tax=Roridomyces roridus TaxID=1738132 RepID=A0AAD7BK94_9AGAR|nr:NAD-P-binding protein [Roridomyces roridus]